MKIPMFKIDYTQVMTRVINAAQTPDALFDAESALVTVYNDGHLEDKEFLALDLLIQDYLADMEA